MLEKGVVFDVCTALAGAAALLRRAGELVEAGRVSRLFDVVEAGLAGCGPERARRAARPRPACAPGVPGSQGRGSNSRASEFTQ